MLSRKIAFWFIWIVPFVSLITVAVGLVSLIALRNGQKAVNELAEQLLERTKQLVVQHLDSYLTTSKDLVMLNAALIEDGQLEWQNFSEISEHFEQQAKRYRVSWINYGLSSGEYAGAGYDFGSANSELMRGETSLATGMRYVSFYTDAHGTIIKEEPDATYDHRREAWYMDTLRAGKLTWSSIYLWEGLKSTISICIGQPIYRGHSQPIGAVGVDLSLTQISNFLRTIQIAPSTRIFIIEQNGLVVASSNTEGVLIEDDDDSVRLNISDSRDPLIRAAAAHLRQQVGSFDQIQTNAAFTFTTNRERNFIRVTPWHDTAGLQWLVVLVVSESDFMAQINAGTRQTIWLSWAALLLAIGLGLFTLRLVTRPVAALRLAAQAVADNQPVPSLTPSGIRELDAVAHSFNYMAAQVNESMRQLAYAAAHDALTGLPNRLTFHRMLTEAIARHREQAAGGTTVAPSPLFAVLFLDLDYFKLVNDSLGHLAGDQLLVEVAQRLLTCIGSQGHVARFGGDEFVILLDPITHSDAIQPIVTDILMMIRQPFLLGDNTAFISTSIGVVFSAHHTTDADGMLRNADIALYRAKANGKAVYEVFDNEMHIELMARLRIEAELRNALSRNELTVYYQPIVDTRSLLMVGAEALLRWHHPELGMVSPAKFIPVAEETGLIIPLGWWVLRSACQQARQWLESFPYQPVVLSVNLSSRQFLHPELFQQIRQILQETGLPPHLLKLEITESLLISDRVTMQTRLNQLRAMGVQLSLDDFGTGYSSLSYLHHFPLDTLKIDRSFVQQVLVDQQCRAIVESIIHMAHKLGMDVIAEGVETEESLAYLRDVAGCEQIQGFLISPAVPATAFDQRLRYQACRPLLAEQALAVDLPLVFN
ncbi:MAG: EAL domain-containing protein [Caldilinea sp. CFX5]|nr:EAL domain-containing protein [Caldilinea sp. CFX5]